jgi:metallo-beta-lactamase family protein
MEIKFLGANAHVTGSKHLIIGLEHNILIDCGLYQGKDAEKENKDIELLLKEEKIDAIILTHGHLDHCGYIPKLYKDGFRGPVFCSKPTKEIANIILTDNAKIQSGNASKQNKRTKKESFKIKPLYTQTEVNQVIKDFKTISLDEVFNWNEYEIEFKEAGHILGAISPVIRNSITSVQFSGDLGRENDISHFKPTKAQEVENIIIESTYGNRIHSEINLSETLKPIFSKAIKENKTILIPAFSLARSQNIMKVLSEFFEANSELSLPVYIDSPMTIAMTEIYLKYSSLHKMTSEQINNFKKEFHFPEYKSQKENLDKLTSPHIILTASGMLSGGNILHHLEVKGIDENNIIFIVGYQAKGTFGADLLNENKELKSNGKIYHIKSEVIKFTNFSSHADKNELLNWVKDSKVKKIFLTHGEEDQKEKLKIDLSHNTNAEIIIPKRSEKFSLWRK